MCNNLQVTLLLNYTDSIRNMLLGHGEIIIWEGVFIMHFVKCNTQLVQMTTITTLDMSLCLRIITATLGAEKGWQSCIIPFVYIWLFSIAFLMCALLLGSPSILEKEKIHWMGIIYYLCSFRDSSMNKHI